MRWGWLLLAALAGYRLWLLWAATPPLDLEETYYLYWSLQPALGYYSKPPMVAWLLGLYTDLFGVSPLVIKSVSLTLHTATALLVFLIGRRLWSPAAGWAGALAFYSLPIIGMLSLFTSTDAALHFCWALTLWAFLRARDSGRLGWWLFTGVAAGLGLLSKYTMGVMAVGLLGYLLATPVHRPLLRSPKLWLGVVVALLVWAPNLWWNARHDFISFRHTAQISQLDHAWLRPGELLDFLLPQWPLFGLLLAPLLLIRLRHCAADDGGRLLLWVSLPMLAVISLQALLAEANLNWASPAYVGLGLLAGACLWQWRRGWLAAALAFNLGLLSVAYHYHALADMLGVQLTARSDPYKHRLGWAGLGRQLQPLLAAHPDTLLVSGDRKLLAWLGYYGGQWPPAVARWNPDGQVVSQYDLQHRDRQMAGRPVLFVSRRPLAPAVLARFTTARQVAVLHQRVYDDLQREIYVYEMSGFRGYGR